MKHGGGYLNIFYILSIVALALLYKSPALADGVVIRAADKVVLEGISEHKQNYLLPATYRAGQGGTEKSELIFQFSAKIQALLPQLYLAYTQTSYWRFLDSEHSRPFRETNYNPEILYHLLPEKNPYGNWGSYIGFEHISNGRALPLSRSLNRAYIWPYWNSPLGEYSLKLWARIPESKKDTPRDTNGDDNPDIYRYIGYGEFYFYRQQHKARAFSGMLRGNPSTGKGAIQLDYSWPLSTDNVTKDTYFFARIFSGYGETLIDYNDHVTRFSIGLEFR